MLCTTQTFLCFVSCDLELICYGIMFVSYALGGKPYATPKASSFSRPYKNTLEKSRLSGSRLGHLLCSWWLRFLHGDWVFGWPDLSTSSTRVGRVCVSLSTVWRCLHLRRLSSRLRVERLFRCNLRVAWSTRVESPAFLAKALLNQEMLSPSEVLTKLSRFSNS